jgi:hypothetical protein
MSEKEKTTLSDALHDAELVELDEEHLEDVAGGACSESCFEGCSACCAIGSANRKPEI